MSAIGSLAEWQLSALWPLKPDSQFTAQFLPFVIGDGQGLRLQEEVVGSIGVVRGG